MKLVRDFSLIINHKKVRRIMRDFELHTIIRRRKRFGTYNELSRNSKPFENLVMRKFSPKKTAMIDSGDITELHYRNGKCYLFAVKYLGNKEIVAYDVATSAQANLIAKAYEKRLRKLSSDKRKNLICHTDQGGQFFSDSFKNTLSRYGVKQSMSERGNCLDNAPIESFFGHMKDELDLNACQSYAEVKPKVEKYINYYNHHRPQWGLNGKTPAECRG